MESSNATLNHHLTSTELTRQHHILVAWLFSLVLLWHWEMQVQMIHSQFHVACYTSGTRRCRRWKWYIFKLMWIIWLWILSSHWNCLWRADIVSCWWVWGLLYDVGWRGNVFTECFISVRSSDCTLFLTFGRYRAVLRWLIQLNFLKNFRLCTLRGECLIV